MALIVVEGAPFSASLVAAPPGLVSQLGVYILRDVDAAAIVPFTNTGIVEVGNPEPGLSDYTFNAPAGLPLVAGTAYTLYWSDQVAPEPDAAESIQVVPPFGSGLLAGERLVARCIETLQLWLPGYITALNAETGAPQIPVPDPEQDYYLGMQDVIPRYPAVEVACASERVGNFTIGLHAGDAAVPVYVVCWAEDPSPNMLARQVYRLSSACAKALVRTDAFGGDAVVTQVDVTYVGQQPENPNPPQYRGAAIMAYQLAVIEGAP